MDWGIVLVWLCCSPIISVLAFRNITRPVPVKIDQYLRSTYKPGSSGFVGIPFGIFVVCSWWMLMTQRRPGSKKTRCRVASQASNATAEQETLAAAVPCRCIWCGYGHRWQCLSSVIDGILYIMTPWIKPPKYSLGACHTHTPSAYLASQLIDLKC